MVNSKHVFRTFGVGFLMCIAISVSYAGGPWTKAKGKYYGKLSEYWIVFDQHYTDSGLIDPNITTGIFSTFLYGEYGITDRLTAVVNGALFSRNYMNNLRSITTDEIIVEGEGINGLGDIDIALKYGLTSQGAKFPMAISLTLGLPTGLVGGGSFENLQTGDGELNQILQFDIGTGFQLGNVPAYLSGYTAFNNRTKGFSDEWRAGLEIGIGLMSERLWVNSKMNVVKSLKNGGLASDMTTGTSIFANNSEFVSIGGEINYSLTESFGVSVGVAGAFSGKLIAASPSYNIGFFVNMD